MTIEFCEAKDGNVTCKCDGLFLHSAYKPLAEAQKFCDQINSSFIPKYVLITEPGISFCCEFLKQKFPHSSICAVRYTDFFSNYDSQFDKVFNLSFTDNKLCEDLFSYMGEDGIFSCLFISWNASEKIFSRESSYCWKEIKKSVLKSNQVLSTRTYFAKRWFTNAVRNCIFLNKTCSINKTDKPVIICASGPSLKNSIPFLKKNLGKYHLFCVSSALSPLVNYGLTPELCITTDGGYFAKRHLSFYASKVKKTIFSIATESAINTSFLRDKIILPLNYGDSPADALFSSCGITSSNALRNGTVSGTAAFLGLCTTSSEVYFCGLDLSESKEFAHTQPNELELTDSLKDSRTNSKETRILPQSFKNSSLDLYSSWFSNTDFGKRLFRLSNNYSFKNKLKNVPDVDWNFFENKNYSVTDENIFVINKEIISSEERKKIIFTEIKNNLLKDAFVSNILPADYLMLKRSFEKDKANIAENINEKMNEFFIELKKKFFSDNDGENC